MSTSDSSRRRAGKNACIYLAVSAFCVVFAWIYARFSHGVHSPFMTYLFAWPLLLGALPSLIGWLFPRIRPMGRISGNLYPAGVAALTVSSLLRGILEIAGTASVYQSALTVVGSGFLAAGIAAYLLRH